MKKFALLAVSVFSALLVATAQPTVANAQVYVVRRRPMYYVQPRPYVVYRRPAPVVVYRPRPRYFIVR